MAEAARKKVLSTCKKYRRSEVCQEMTERNRHFGPAHLVLLDKGEELQDRGRFVVERERTVVL